MPWIQYHRDKLRRDKNPSWQAYANCQECEHPKAVKRSLHCGHLSESTWLEPGWVAPACFPIIPQQTTCPGYLASLPAVMETARAHGWRTNLSDYYEDVAPTKILMECIDILDAERSAVEAHAMTPEKK